MASSSRAANRLQLLAATVAACAAIAATAATHPALNPDPSWPTFCKALWHKKVEKYRIASSQIDSAEAASFADLVTNGRVPKINENLVKRAFDNYEAEWHCEDEERLGTDGNKRLSFGDGPKFVCGIDALKAKPDCLVYSIGSNYDFRFEDGIHARAPGCEIHTFDGTMDLTKIPLSHANSPGVRDKKIKFHNWNMGKPLGASMNRGQAHLDDSRTRSMGQIVRTLGHANRSIDLFKIDCEGCEHTEMAHVMELVAAGQLEIGQIFIEVHWGTPHTPAIADFTKQLSGTFRSLRQAGMMIFHKERNQWGCDGYKCVEYSLVSPAAARYAFEATHCPRSLHHKHKSD